MVVNEAGEVVGADLVSKGMTITVNGDEAATKMDANGNWVNGDVIGLAWYNLNRNGQIGNTQDEATWLAKTNNRDYKIYNVPSFTTEDNGATWTTMANVYQGAYYAYYPWERIGEPEEMVITPNEPAQTGAWDTDRYTNKFQISAQDFLSKMEGVTEDNTLEHDFYLTTPLNAFAVVPNPNAYITSNDYLKAMYIANMTVKTNSYNNVIVTKGTVHPQLIPHVERTFMGDIDAEATRTAMDAAIANLNPKTSYISYVDADKASAVTTTMGDNKSFNLAGGENLHQIRVFTFPITEALPFDNYAPSVEFVVKGNNGPWDLGTFTVDANQPASATLIANLKKLFGNDAEWSMTKILRGTTGGPKVLASEGSMSAVLTPQNFEPAVSNITEEEQWADLVKLVDALTGPNGKYTAGDEVTFTLGDNLTFDSNIPTPEKGVKIELVTTSSYSLTVTGKTEWPANLDVDKDDKIVVEGKLYVGATGTETAGQEIILDATIDNNGTIYAGPMVSISTKDDKALDNTNGTVFVEYGAYVYPSEEATVGEIAFEVTDSEPTTMHYINTLIQKDGEQYLDKQNEYAYVNTLWIGTKEAQVTLNLNALAKEGDDGDRYEDVETPAQYLLPLNLIDIVLVNGKVVYKKGDDNENVKNVISRDGKNEIRDIIPLGNITIEEGSILTIESDEVYGLYSNEDKDLVLPAADATITNYGTLNVTTNVETVNIYNMDYSTSVINVDPDEHIWYMDVYVQDGQTKGDIVRNPNAPQPELSALGQVVVTAFEAYKASSDAPKSLDEMVNKLNSKGAALLDNKGNWASSDLYFALSDWMEAEYGVGLNETGTPTTLTVKMFENFQNAEQYTFTF